MEKKTKKTRRLALIFANTFYDDNGKEGLFKNLSPHSKNDGEDLKILLEYLGYEVYLVKDVRVTIPEKEVVKENPKEESENTLDLTPKSESIPEMEILDFFTFDSVIDKKTVLSSYKNFIGFNTIRKECINNKNNQVLSLFIYTGHGVIIKNSEESTFIVPVNWSTKHPYVIPESYISSLFPGGENHFFFLGCSTIVENSQSIIDKKIEYDKTIGKNNYYYAAMRDRGVPIIKNSRNTIYCTILMNELINCIKKKTNTFGDLFPAERNEKGKQYRERLEIVDNDIIKASEKQLQRFIVKIFPPNLNNALDQTKYTNEKNNYMIVKDDLVSKVNIKIETPVEVKIQLSTLVQRLNQNRVFVKLYWTLDNMLKMNNKLNMEKNVSKEFGENQDLCVELYANLLIIVEKVKSIGLDRIRTLKSMGNIIIRECEKFLEFIDSPIAKILKNMIENKLPKFGTKGGSFYVYLFFKKKDDEKLSKIEKLSKEYGFTLDVLTKEQFFSETKGSMLLIENDNQSKVKKVYFVEDVQDLNNEKELCVIKYEDVFPNSLLEEKKLANDSTESQQDNESLELVSKPSIYFKGNSIAYLSSYRHVFFWFDNEPFEEVVSNNIIIDNVVCGGGGVFVLSKLGKWYAYGNNNFFVLGLNEEREYRDLTLHPFLNNQKKVLRIESRGCFSFFCVENENGEKQLYGCGENKFLGVNKKSGKSGYPPIRIEKFSNDLKDIKKGYSHSFVMTEKENKIYSTGTNNDGQCALGGGGYQYEYSWKEVKYFRENGIKVKNIECGECSSYFLTEKNEVYSCGENLYGELGLNDKKQRIIPTLIKHGIQNNVRKMFIPDDNAFFLCNNGKLMACGLNYCKESGVKNDNRFILIPTELKIEINEDDDIKRIIVLRKYHTVIVFESGKMKELRSNSKEKKSLVKRIQEIEEYESILKEYQSLFDEKKYEKLSKMFKKSKGRTIRRIVIRYLKEIENEKEMVRVLYENWDKFVSKEENLKLKFPSSLVEAFEYGDNYVKLENKILKTRENGSKTTMVNKCVDLILKRVSYFYDFEKIKKLFKPDEIKVLEKLSREKTEVEKISMNEKNLLKRFFGVMEWRLGPYEFKITLKRVVNVVETDKEVKDFIEENQKKTETNEIEPKIAKKFLSLVVEKYSSKKDEKSENLIEEELLKNDPYLMYLKKVLKNSTKKSVVSKD